MFDLSETAYRSAAYCWTTARTDCGVLGFARMRFTVSRCKRPSLCLFFTIVHAVVRRMPSASACSSKLVKPDATSASEMSLRVTLKWYEAGLVEVIKQLPTPAPSEHNTAKCILIVLALRSMFRNLRQRFPRYKLRRLCFRLSSFFRRLRFHVLSKRLSILSEQKPEGPIGGLADASAVSRHRSACFRKSSSMVIVHR